jgi:hypothetical protein
MKGAGLAAEAKESERSRKSSWERRMRGEGGATGDARLAAAGTACLTWKGIEPRGGLSGETLQGTMGSGTVGRAMASKARADGGRPRVEPRPRHLT